MITSFIFLLIFTIINGLADHEIDKLYDKYHNGDREKINERMRKAFLIKNLTALAIVVMAVLAFTCVVIRQF